MNRVERFRSRLEVVCCLGLLVVGLSDVRAEISTQVDPDGKPNSIVIVTEVIDSGDPIEVHWSPVGDSGGRVLLNPGGEADGDSHASILFDRSRDLAVAVWADAGPGGYDLVQSTFADGAWAEPVAIATTSAQEQDPVLVHDRQTGVVHLLYWIDGSPARVAHRQAPEDLTSWSEETIVSLPSQTACRPHAVLQGGSLHVVYEAWSDGAPATPRLIALATLEAGGWSHDYIAVTQFGAENWPRIHAKRGRLWVDWIDASGELAWSRRITGGWSAVEVEAFTDLGDLLFRARGRVAAEVLP